MNDNAGISREQLIEALAKAQVRIAELEGAAAKRWADLDPGTGSGVTDATASESVPHHSDATFRNVLDASPVPSALNDEQQNIVYLNPAFIDMFGYDLGDIPTLDDWWPRAYPDPDYRRWVAREWQAHLDQARRKGQVFEPLELTIRCKDGSSRTAVVGAASLAEAFRGIHLVTLFDITERKRAEIELNNTAAMLENVLNSTPDLVFVKDGKLQTILCNEAYARAVGKRREEMYSNTDIENGWAPELVYGDPDKGIRGFMQDDRDALSGKDVHNPYDPANVDGEVRVFDTHKLPLRDAGGNIIGVLGVARDITERRRAEQELQQHRHRLEAMVNERTSALADAVEELESFSYSVSHDLRAPLRAIDGFSHALLEDYADTVDDTGKDYLRRIRVNAQRMGQLIDDLLSLSRVSSCELDERDADLSSMAKAAVEKLKSYEPNRKVNVDIVPGMHGWADARLMEVVLDNLLGNAWKYTSKTERTHIEFGSLQEGGRTIYYVRDNGVGFDMKYADKLFGAFQRLHDAEQFEGTGIGLATVARIIHRHGGKVWADAIIDEGTTVYFTLGKPSSQVDAP